jgi:hypothetical protein
LRALHHVIHFNEAKIENDNNHMNAQAGMWFRNAIAADGSAMRGAMPGKRLAWGIVERPVSTAIVMVANVPGLNVSRAEASNNRPK